MVDRSGRLLDLDCPAVFKQKKQRITQELSRPQHLYEDRSPKGSIDQAILPLVGYINEQHGLVTTSSCAGRISVFLEGRKTQPIATAKSKQDNASLGGMETAIATSQASNGGHSAGGRWLYVSHDAVEIPPSWSAAETYFGNLYGLSVGESEGMLLTHADFRCTYFKFEPMILHILSASLQHAQKVLTAALTSGFRESGAVNVTPGQGHTAMPMIAVRSAGLALESIIGGTSQIVGENHTRPGSMVSERYLHMLTSMANRRMKENTSRLQRFHAALRELCSPTESHDAAPSHALSCRGTPSDTRDWEDANDRRERLKAEGLRRKLELRKQPKLTDDLPVDQDGLEQMNTLFQ
ncbi:MAG: hypothetical protein M1833_006222 [Piccolia ochrophora]|nr:MAG: hypothetical protein M1833_006222 [Piccolia ochrophora]